MRHSAQFVSVEGLVGPQISDLDPKQILKGASDVVDFGNFLGTLHGRFEFRLGRLGMLRQTHGNKDDVVTADLFRVQDGTVASDDTTALKLLHPPQTCRRR